VSGTLGRLASETHARRAAQKLRSEPEGGDFFVIVRVGGKL